MSDWFLIPLDDNPQSFQISLAGTNYIMTVYWNAQLDGGWEFNLDNADSGNSVLAGAPFVTGANLLAGLNYLGIGGDLYVYTNGMPDAVPTFDNLGTDSNLYFVTNATVN